MRFINSSLAFSTGIVAILIIAGCGDGLPTRVPVSGTVLIDGQPLQQGFIQVIPAGERAASSPIGQDGSFRLTTYQDGDGSVLGTHQVVVIANESQGATAMKWHAPKQYADTETSDLTLEVTQPSDDVKIELTWNGGAPFVEKFGDEGIEPPPE
jgi:hypothetical protein